MNASNYDSLSYARQLYCATRRQAVALRRDISAQKFDSLVQSALPAVPSPADWCRKATELLALIKSSVVEVDKVTTQVVSNYFGQAR